MSDSPGTPHRVLDGSSMLALMDALTLAVMLLTLALAAANGANDVSKGIATLAGAGVARYRTAILWGTGTTFVGAVASLAIAERLTVLFSRGIVTAPPTLPFAVAVLVGASAWVGFATVTRLPVSTTHAIVGALIGAGIELAPAAVNWSVLLTNVVGPLLASIGVAYAASAALSWARSERVRITMTAAHWLTSGATGLARGLNDTPKIVAIGAFALVPSGGDPRWLVGAVAVAMAIGGVIAGRRVARSLGEKVVRMDHLEGFRANLATALLVGVGANLGLPMSTTHVATGAIAGLTRAVLARLNRRTLRDFGGRVDDDPAQPGRVGLVSDHGQPGPAVHLARICLWHRAGHLSRQGAGASARGRSSNGESIGSRATGGRSSSAAGTPRSPRTASRPTRA